MERAKRGLEKFCTMTSMHGFAEMYYARTHFWKICWFVVVFAALGITIYQVSDSATKFLNEPTDTRILSAKEDEIVYPPLKMCYTHWLFWVDWKRSIRSLNISKEAMLYGLNYINVMYSNEIFDLMEIQSEFREMMLKNGFTSIKQFFVYIARPVPVNGDNQLASYFDEIEVFYKDPAFVFCYKISEKQMRKYFDDNRVLYDAEENSKTISFTTYDESYNSVKDYVTVEEYNNYMLRWLSLKSMYSIKSNESNLTSFAPPIWIYPNAYSDKSVDIYFENDLYYVGLDASARTVKNTPRNVCVESAGFASNDGCKRKCRALKLKATCSCLSLDVAFTLNTSTVDSLCEKGFVFLTPNGKMQASGTKTYSNQNCTMDADASLQYEKCVQSCIHTCTVWTYEFSVIVTRMALIVRQLGTKATTNVSVDYPFGNQISFSVEVDSYSWSDLISSIGGLLGIWTGASIVSFLQVFYLCCCADNDMPSLTASVVPIRIKRRLTVKPNTESNAASQKAVQSVV